MDDTLLPPYSSSSTGGCTRERSRTSALSAPIEQHGVTTFVRTCDGCTSGKTCMVTPLHHDPSWWLKQTARTTSVLCPATSTPLARYRAPSSSSSSSNHRCHHNSHHSPPLSQPSHPSHMLPAPYNSWPGLSSITVELLFVAQALLSHSVSGHGISWTALPWSGQTEVVHMLGQRREICVCVCM